MSIELMERALEFITGVYFGEHEGSRSDREKLEADLTTAIQQAEAQQPTTAIACGIPGMAKTTCPYCEQGFAFEHEQPATGEPVWCVATGERVNGEETYTHHDAYVPLADCFPLYTRPAPSVRGDVVRDAERYRWMRDHDHWPAPFSSSQEPEPVRGRDLDAAIDAAMLAAKKASA